MLDAGLKAVLKAMEGTALGGAVGLVRSLDPIPNSSKDKHDMKWDLPYL